jgi:ribosomal protein L14
MSFLLILLIMFCVSLFNALKAEAASTPVLVVSGKVTDTNGKNVPKGPAVIVENQTQKLSLETTIGAEDGEEGIYSVTFINFTGKSVAASGDNIKVSVKGPAGNIAAVETYQLKDADITAAYARIDLKVQALAPSTPIFVVAGSLIDEIGLDVKELLVLVENQANKLIEKAKISEVKGDEGKYTVTFFNFEGKIVAQVGDMIKVSVQNANGNVMASQSYQLKEADIAAAQAVINIRIPKVITAVERQGKLHAIWANMKIAK